MEQSGGLSRDPSARTIAVVYLLYFLVALTSGLLIGGIVVRGAPAATASHLLASGTRYRIAIGIDVIANLLYMTVTALFYRLFRPVSPSLSLIAAFLSLAGCVVQIGSNLLRLAALLLLRDASLAIVFSPSQLQAVALTSLNLYAQSFQLSFVLFACFDVVLGTLILKSNFLPRFLGIMMVAAGVAWLAFLWPPLATSLRWIVLPLGGLAEVALMLWLLVKGVGPPK